MRYCNNCRKLTAGEPLFCNFCGRSYDHKLCPHRHINPRTAEVCSQCGSREFSTPHPRVPLWLSAGVASLSFLPGVLLLLLSVIFLLAFVHALLSSPQLLFQFMLAGLLLSFVWWLYMQLPRFVRRLIAKLLGRSGDDGGHSGHGH